MSLARRINPEVLKAMILFAINEFEFPSQYKPPAHGEMLSAMVEFIT